MISCGFARGLLLVFFSGAAVRPLGGTQVFAVFCTAHPAAGPLCAVSLLKKLNSFLSSFLEGAHVVLLVRPSRASDPGAIHA